MKRLIIIIALLLVPVMAFGEGYPGRGAPNYSLRCWPTNLVVADQDFSNAQVIDTAVEGCTDGSLTVVDTSTGGISSSSNNCPIVSSGSWNETGLSGATTSVTRSIGYGLFSKLNISVVDTPSGVALGFAESGGISISDLNSPMFTTSNPNIYVTPPSSAVKLGTVAASTVYSLLQILGGYNSSGVPYKAGDPKADFLYGGGHLIKGGAYTNCTLIWKASTSNTSPVYPSINTISGNTYTLSNILIPNIDFSDLLQPAHLSTFTAADDTALGDYTPDVGGAWTELTGDWIVNGNKVSTDTTGRVISYISSPVNVFASLHVTPQSATFGSWGGFAANISDNQNYWILNISYVVLSADSINIFSVESNITTSRASTNISDISADTEYLVHYRFDGTTRIIYYSSYSASSTYSFNDTIETIGLVSDPDANYKCPKFDNFSVWPITSNAYDNAFARVGY
jgi:hypothetical protein